MAKKITKKQWIRRKRIKAAIVFGIVSLMGAIILFLVCVMVGNLFQRNTGGLFANFHRTGVVLKPEIQEMLLTPNEFSRPEISIKKVKGVVVHYTANPGSDAVANRDYFEGLKDSGETSASSHFIIGLDGTIIQCVPLDEIAYTSNTRNEDTISIECCHLDETGKFTEETYESLVKLTAWLSGKFNLKEDEIIRHYDVTGKDCPRYYVKHEDQWKQFKKEVFLYIEEHEKNNP